jgi:hypothetical protein
MYGGFGDNVGVQTVAKFDWVDIVTISTVSTRDMPARNLGDDS